MKAVLTALCVLLLSGCAICREHQTACIVAGSVGVMVATGAIIASSEHHSAAAAPANCGTGLPNGCRPVGQ
jgi:uncharacterized protein YceK